MVTYAGSKKAKKGTRKNSGKKRNNRINNGSITNFQSGPAQESQFVASGSENKDTAKRTVSKRYMPGLDGLRALAVLAVIAYHLNLPWAAGGFLGVGIFFTLSGYLITGQLLFEWESTGKIDFKDFWYRRMRRILPAFFLMLATTFIWLLIFDPGRINSVKGDYISSILYFNNLYKISQNVSYFERFGPQSPLGHLWSLSIEEQFYIIWPVLLAIGLRFILRRDKMVLFTAIGAIGSMMAMTMIYKPGADPSRVYYGTDTRAFAILIGAAFAMVYPGFMMSRQIPPKKKLFLDAAGITALLLCVTIILKTNEYQSSLYLGGLVVFAVLSAVLTVIAAHPSSFIGKLLGIKPLRWIGTRSYGLYLWHYPVIILTTPTVNTHGLNAFRIILQLGATFLLSEMSWRLIENPVRHIKFDQVREKLPSLAYSQLVKSVLLIIIALLSFHTINITTNLTRENAAIAAVSEKTGDNAEEADSSSGMPDSPAADPDRTGQQQSGQSHANSSNPGDTQAVLPGNQGTSSPDNANKDTSKDEIVHPVNTTPGENPDGQLTAELSSGTGSDDPHNPDELNLPSQQAENENATGESTAPQDQAGHSHTGEQAGENLPSTLPADGQETAAIPTGNQEPHEILSEEAGEKGNGILVIGDSIIINVKPYLEELLPGIVVDGMVSRQMLQAGEVIDQYLSYGRFDRIVIELGTNGPFPEDDLRQLLSSLGSMKQILLVNTRVPRNWQNIVNASLDKVAKEFDNVSVVDWFSASKGKDSFFTSDGVHLTPEGASCLASIIAEGIKW